MRLIPVIDLKNGIVVRGIGGRRDEYRPLVSRLTTSVDPVEVARVLVERFRPKELYLADLDAIAGAAPAWPLFDSLRSFNIERWVDAGVRDAKALAAAGIEAVICGLESLAGPDVLAAIVRELGPERTIFSLDLKGGRPVGNFDAWRTTDAISLVDAAVALGIRRLIVLDLEAVGVGQGPGTLELCTAIRAVHSNVEIIAGGGIRDSENLQQLARCGVDAALVASALHDGRITAESMRRGLGTVRKFKWITL